MTGLRWLFLALGLAVLVGVVAAAGWSDVVAAFAAIGWGLAWIVLYHVVPLACDTVGWARLVDRGERPAPGRLAAMRWIGESVNNLLPVAQVGGEVVRIRLATRAGVDAARAGAGVVVDLSLGLITQAIFALVGLAALAGAAEQDDAVGPLSAAIAAFAVVVVLFVLAQRGGIIGRGGDAIERVGTRLGGNALARVAGGMEQLDSALHVLYRQQRRLAVAAAWRMASWLTGAVEVWLALRWLGHPVGPAEAVAIQSLAMAARSAAFLVPGGLGVQEGGFVAVSALLGVPPATGIALALVRRVREVVFGLPGLLLWWTLETRAK